MQAVILAAGRGTRMGVLTGKMPKPMLEVAGKTLLEHKFDALPDEVDEIVLVVGYLGEIIRAKYRDSYNGKKVTYVEQENIVGGTMDALLAAKPLLHDRFFVMYADDLYSANDMRACLQYEWALVVERKETVGPSAKVVIEHGLVKNIVEKEHHDGGEGYANAALFLMDMRIFGYEPVRKDANSTEIGLPQTFARAARDIPVHAVEATFWFPITEPGDLERAEQALAI